MTSGTSVIPAMPHASVIRQSPPPDVEVIARAPVRLAPTAMQAAAISSSACTATMPKSPACAAIHSSMVVAGVIG